MWYKRIAWLLTPYIDAISDTVSVPSFGWLVLHNSIKEMQEHQREIQKAINVLEKKIQFVEKHLPDIAENKPHIETFPIRFYVSLGSEISAAASSAFFKYPTFVQYNNLSSGK